MSEKTKKEVELPVYETLKKIKEGGLNPALLPKGTRQLCVGALAAEGYSSGQIADLLKKSDRTIRRDMVDVRKMNSISANPEFTGIIGGELLSTARSQFGRLKQIARSNDVSAKDKAKMEYMSWLIIKEATDKLHKIGFLPMSVEDHSNDADKEKSSESGIDPAMQRLFEAMGPMDRERLIDKLYKDIIGLKEEDEKEPSAVMA